MWGHAAAFSVLERLPAASKATQESIFGLVLGRILGGISTSILTTTLEVWVVHRHRELGFAEELLAQVIFPSMGTSFCGLHACWDT